MKLTARCSASVHGNKGIYQHVQQLRSTAKRNKLYHALATESLRVSRVSLLLVC